MSLVKQIGDNNLELGELLKDMMTCLTSQSYLYSPLPSKEHIRILWLNPGLRGTPIHCSLHAMSLNNPDSYPAPSPIRDPFSGYKGPYDKKDIKYTALSYTWGNPSLDHTLLCETTRGLKVTSNLHAALQRLRREDEHRLVWADAVCIDQNNIQERAEQVQLMRQIYSAAAETIVFLGEADEEPNMAMDLGRKIIDLTKTLRSGTRVARDTFERHGLPCSGSKEWAALGLLYSLPWFRRVWTIQEFALSPNLLFLWGQFTFDFAFLMLLQKCILNCGMQSELLRAIRAVPGYSDDFAIRMIGKITWMEVLWERTMRSDFPPIISLLDRSSIKESTDPRDQIYAVVGISDRMGKPDFVPDYSLTLHQTYGKAFKCLLKEGPEGLSFLHLVGLPRSHLELPSWIPDLSTLKSTHRITNIAAPFSAGGPGDTEIESAELNTSKDSHDNKWDVTDDLKVLVAQAAIVDTIEECLDECLEAETLNDNAASYFSNSFLLTLRSRGDATDLEKIRRHASTIFFGVQPEDMSEVMLMYSYMAGVIDQSDDEQTTRAARVIMQAAVKAIGFRYCLTQGGTTGQIPDEGRAGDKVCIFPGMRTPFLIREREVEKDSFYLIGECYMDGFMYHDEVNKNADVKFQKIKIV